MIAFHGRRRAGPRVAVALRARPGTAGCVMLGGMTNAPVNLSQALASFGDIYSPRIVGRVNDYDVRIAHARGEHVWHVHEDTDEFFLVLDGTFDVSLREAGTERTVNLRAGIQADRWEASFFCQNASNRVGSTSVLDGAGFKSLSYGIPPRTMGLMVRYAFE